MDSDLPKQSICVHVSVIHTYTKTSGNRLLLAVESEVFVWVLNCQMPDVGSGSQEFGNLSQILTCARLHYSVSPTLSDSAANSEIYAWVRRDELLSTPTARPRDPHALRGRAPRSQCPETGARHPLAISGFGGFGDGLG